MATVVVFPVPLTPTTMTTVGAPVAGGAAPQIDVRARVAEVEREAVIDALQATGGNQTRAAKQLGISRFALIRLIEKHDLRIR